MRHDAVDIASLNANGNLRSGWVKTVSNRSSVLVVLINVSVLRPLYRPVLVSWRRERQVFKTEAVVVNRHDFVWATFARMRRCRG